MLVSTDLFSVRSIGWRGLARFNAQLFTHRAMVLAELLRTRWGICGSIDHLPERPVWWINAACLETATNWRFSKREMGDWRFGRHFQPKVPIAIAAAASAAVPYAVGALRLDLPSGGWYRTDPATRRPTEKRQVALTSVRLWDGGAYENLGLEPLFKPQSGLLGCDFLICSDASGPLSTASPTRMILQGELVVPRLFALCSDQI